MTDFNDLARRCEEGSGGDRGIKPLASPMVCPSAYSLHLYCKYENPEHGFDEFPHEPDNCETRGQAVRVAKSWGWKIHRDGTATCPKCARALAHKDLSHDE